MKICPERQKKALVALAQAVVESILDRRTRQCRGTRPKRAQAYVQINCQELHDVQVAWDVVIAWWMHQWMSWTWLQQLERVLDSVGVRSERAGGAEKHAESQT